MSMFLLGLITGLVVAPIILLAIAFLGNWRKK